MTDVGGRVQADSTDDGLGTVDDDLGSRLDRVIYDVAAVQEVHRYFANSPGDRFTGASFERLGGGGNSVPVRNVVTADDVVSLSLLSIRVSGMVALKLLVDRQEELSQLLGEIRTDVPLWDADRTLLAGHASSLWKLICRLDEGDDIGFRPVTAAKLMARKRPALIPISDSVVRGVVTLKKGASWWLSLQAALQDVERRARIDRLRSEAGLNDEVTILRTLDVALWMHGRRSGTPVEIEV